MTKGGEAPRKRQFLEIGLDVLYSVKTLFKNESILWARIYKSFITLSLHSAFSSQSNMTCEKSSIQVGKAMWLSTCSWRPQTAAWRKLLYMLHLHVTMAPEISVTHMEWGTFEISFANTRHERDYGLDCCRWNKTLQEPPGEDAI